MKILSVHVENFGKLSDVNIDFKEGTNILKEGNGWGKSTLATFIRALFYGLEGDGKRDDIQCERKRFAPWQGGAFGGSIVFETHGKTYYMTRFFGTKAAEDTFELRDNATNLPSSDYSDKIGEELFHINSESFMNTVFIRQSDAASSKATDDVNARLGNISDGMDLNKYALAETVIKDTLNAMSATRKTGEIAKDKARASEIKASLRAGTGLKDTISNLEARIKTVKSEADSVKSELSGILDRKKEAMRLERLLNDKKAYEALLNEVNLKESQLRERTARFPGKVPSKDEAKALETAASELKQAKAVYDSTAFNESEEVLYNNLIYTFKDGIPRAEDLDAAAADAEKLAALRAQTARNSLSEAEADKLNRYKTVYKDPESLRAETDATFARWNDRARMKGEIRLLEKDLSDKEYLYDEKRGSAVLTVIGFMLLLAGAVLFALDYIPGFENPVKVPFLSYILAAVGIALLVYKLKKSAGLKQDKRVLAADINGLKETISGYTDEIADIEEATERLLYDCGIAYDEVTVPKVLQGLLMDSYEYGTLAAKEKAAAEDDSFAVCERLSADIKDYLSKFSVFTEEPKYVSLLTELKGKTAHYQSLSAKSAGHRDAGAKCESLYNNIKFSLDTFGIAPGADIFETVEDVLDAQTECESLRELAADAKARLDEFSNTHNPVELTAPIPEDFETPDMLHEKEEELTARLDELKEALRIDTANLDGYRERYENWLDESDKLAELEESIEYKKKKLSLVEKTGEILAEAKESLTARYMEPLMKGFAKYYSVLTGEPADAYRIDADTNITVLEKGRQRASETLSAGYKDLIGFCMRLAMADAMYTGEKPTLVMDDPFVNLDDTKLKGAEKLLKEAGEVYQIIYLTCRDERRI
ncbi:MAG: AAA family ATPase [Lachnospiraceae bacterium]|nr:AAA family ATPase [Lachnospiraceae bacterium]